MPEELDPKNIEDTESDEPTEPALKRRRAVDPTKGHKRPSPHDLSGPDPSAQVMPGQIAPRLAGDRAKAIIVMGRVKGFIEKYSEFAQEKLGVSPGGVDPRTGEKLAGREEPGKSLLSKDRVLQLVDKLPMMPSSQMMFATRAIGNYIWRIHATVREGIRHATKGRLKKQGQVGFRTKFDPSTGEEKPTKTLDTDTPGYKEALRAASREFDLDSTNIKADLNMLAAVGGVLKRSGGFGGKADMTFLDKVMKGYVDDSGQYHVKSVEIRPRAPDVALPPELQRLSGWAGEQEPPAASADEPGPRAQGPVIRKGAAKPFTPAKSDVGDKEAEEELRKMGLADTLGRQFDSWINEVIELSVADRFPNWWDEL